MDQLFPTSGFVDFGPSRLSLPMVGTRVQVVHGNRPAVLKGQIRVSCPKKPGIYGMIDTHGELIYVGKARLLRTRLLSYFRTRSRDPKAGRILRHTTSIAWEVNLSEFAALHRELELIRRWRPRYNVQGQPGRWQYTYVCLGRRPAPYVFLTRRPPAGVLASFGPVPAGQRAAEAARRLNDWFQLRDCPQQQEMVFANDRELFALERTPGCLRYEIGTCLGPCIAACTRDAYAEQVRAARAFLSGADVSLLTTLEQQMQQAAAQQEYERATALRDRWAALRWLYDQLEQLRQLQINGSFIYPVWGHDGGCLWYLIHGGRTVAVLAPPADMASRRAAAALIEAVYEKEQAGRGVEYFEQIHGLLLVASWFRRYPAERERALTPAQALARCR
jgi:excinuclease ABC subunit C